MVLLVGAGAMLAFTYLVTAVGRALFLRIDCTGAAIVGATLMIASGVISLDEAYQHIDFRTLVFLFGTMVVIAHWSSRGAWNRRRSIARSIGICWCSSSASSW